MKPYSAPTIKGALVGKDLVQDRFCWHYYKVGNAWSRAQSKPAKHGARQYAKKSILQDMLAEALEDQRLADQEAYEDAMERYYDAYADDYCDDRFDDPYGDWDRDDYESFISRFDPDYDVYGGTRTGRYSSHYSNLTEVESDGYGEDNRLYWDASDEGWKERTEARAWVHLEMEAKDEAWARHIAGLDAACDDELDIDDVLFMFEPPEHMHFNDWIGRKPR